MRVATLNLWGRSGAWPDRRRLLIDGFRDLAPDVVLFQEAEDHDHVADLLDPAYHVVHRGWLAVAARGPLGAVRELEFEGQATTLLVGVGDLLVVNHFPPWAPDREAEREAHTVAAARLVEQVAGDRPVVLGGDLDATPDAASIRFLRGRQSLDGYSVSYWDAWQTVHGDEPGHTFTPRNPLVMEESDVTREEPRRIDYLFVRAGARGPCLNIVDCRLIFEEPPASDHYGVMANLDPFD
jgi:endonuclease/exonuclease/phosphatase family metal-dependent hydrolase